MGMVLFIVSSDTLSTGRGVGSQPGGDKQKVFLSGNSAQVLQMPFCCECGRRRPHLPHALFPPLILGLLLYLAFYILGGAQQHEVSFSKGSPPRDSVVGWLGSSCGVFSAALNIGSFRLEKMFRVIELNYQPTLCQAIIKPYSQAPHLLSF